MQGFLEQLDSLNISPDEIKESTLLDII